jgi:hypothetical protein
MAENVISTVSYPNLIYQKLYLCVVDNRIYIFGDPIDPSVLVHRKKKAEEKD